MNEKRNQFLVEMHELEEKFRTVLGSLGLSPSSDNMATIALHKALQFADQFEGNTFFETITGSILIEYFLLFTEEKLELLEQEIGKNTLLFFLQGLFWKGTIPSYLDDCSFMEVAAFADLGEVYAELLATYITLHEDMSKEELGYILALVKEEVVTLENEETSSAIVQDVVSILLEDDSFKEKIEYTKILKK